MNFWPGNFMSGMTPYAFQPVAPHFNNPAWEVGQQAMMPNPAFYGGAVNPNVWASAPIQGSSDGDRAPNPWLTEEERLQMNGRNKSGDRERDRERESRSTRYEKRRGSSPENDRWDSDSRSRDDDDNSNRGRRRSRDRSRERSSRWEDDDKDRRRKRRRHDDDDDNKDDDDDATVDKCKSEDGDNLESANYKTQKANDTIMIRGLAQHISENDIRQDIVECGLMPKDIRLIRKKDTGISRGFAFVEFNNTEEAQYWMELKQGVLMLQDQYRAVMQFSVEANNPMEGYQTPADWDCVKCYAHNFKKRKTCFKCSSLRPDSVEAVSDEVSPHPTPKILLTNLDPMVDEEKLLKEMSTITSIPIQGCEIGRDSQTQLSRCVCYLELKNILEAIKLYNELTEKRWKINNKRVFVSYCKLQQPPTPGASTQWSTGDQQYTLADVPQLAEYSARMYASTAEQKAQYMQYYTQYYTNQITQQMKVSEATDANAAAAVAQTAIQLAQSKKAALAAKVKKTDSPVAATPAPVTPTYPSTKQLIGNSSIGVPDTSSYYYDESSGYYFDSKTGLYYDSKTQYFYHSQEQVYLYWDGEKNCYQLASSDGKQSKHEEGKEEKKKEKQQDKVKVAKRIAKDMERWAKTLNQKKDVARQNIVAVQQSLTAAKAAATADIAYDVLERKAPAIMSDIPNYPPANDEREHETLVPSYGGGSDSDDADETPNADEEFHTDWAKLACLLCKRQLPNKDALQRHNQLSDLHKQNLEAWYRSRGLEPPKHKDLSQGNYRDRAKERRQKFGVPDTPKPSRLKEKYMKEQEELRSTSYEEPTRAGIPSGNLGSKMLQKMGWSEGMGLGKMNQGRTEIVQAVQRVSTAGLGVAGSSLGTASGNSGNSYKENVKRAAMIRFNEMK